MIILKIIGWVILSVIALILLVLCIKVRIFAEYSEIDTHAYVKWLFIKIPLYPVNKSDKPEKATQTTPSAAMPEQSEAPVATEQTAPAEEAQAADASEQPVADAVTADAAEPAPVKSKNNLLKTLYEAHGIDGLMLIVKRVFSYLGSFIGDLMKALVIDELYVDVRCTKGDAASTAIYYGEVCAGLFPMLGALIGKYKVRKYDINVYPDYLARHSSASFAVSMHLYPIYLIGVTLHFAFRMLFKVVFRLFGKIFLPAKNKKEENSDNTGDQKPAEAIKK